MPPTVNGWTRLEPYARSEGLEGGLRAAVRDPLWLLARQWQLGEFWGEDVGTPVGVRLRLDCTPLTRYQPGGIPPGAAVRGQALDAAAPLEVLVERERVRVEGEAQPRLAAEAGLHFWRLLDAAGAGAQRAAVLARWPLRAPAEDPRQPLDGDTARFLQIMAGRAPDGGLLYSVLRVARDPAAAAGLPEEYRAAVAAGVESWRAWAGALPEPDRGRVDRAAAGWLAWAAGLFSEPGPAAPGAPAWIPERLEYEVAAAAPAPGGEVVLAAPEYTEGHLDWYAFNLLPSGSLGASRADLTPAALAREAVRRAAIPTPVTFPGMPASRWWEFEDARVDFGAVQAGPQDLARLLLIEFALIYGADWFVLPVDVPVGVLSLTRWLVVTDTFGERTLVRSARAVDRERLAPRGGPLPWDLFRLSPDRRPAAAGARPVPDALFLPPALGAGLQGAPLEEVLFLRDELANLAWAVERIVESPAGRPVNRSEAFFRAGGRREDGAAGDGVGAVAADGTPPPLVYRLATAVPDHWIPLIPVRIREGDPAMRLLRAGAPRGRVLEPGRDPARNPLHLSEEEVPRAGARVIRAFQYARWTDGGTHLWMGRRKGAGRGEGASGLRFDVLEPADRPGS